MLSIFKKLFPSPIDYQQVLSRRALIIDVRTKGEFAGGHIKGSVNIPLDELPRKIAELQQKQQTLITVCRSSNRSGIAKKMLKSANIEVYNGGAWNSLEQKIK